MREKDIIINEIGETWEGENLIVKDGREVIINSHGYEHFERSSLL